MDVLATSIPELPPPTSMPTEWPQTGRPLLLQLAGMGWEVMAGDADVPDPGINFSSHERSHHGRRPASRG